MMPKFLLAACSAGAVVCIASTDLKSNDSVFDEQIRELLAVSDNKRNWPEANIDKQAEAVFKPGTKLANYITPTQKAGFKLHTNQGSANTFVLTHKAIKPLSIGVRELRIVITTDDNSLISKVQGRVFLHTP
ncbi:protein of unknown function [Hyphomicrobium sp. 1Nfss2.1]